MGSRQLRGLTAIQVGALFLPLLGSAFAAEPPTSDEALIAKYPVADAGRVTRVTLEPGALGFHGFQGGIMTVTLSVSAVEKGFLTIGQGLTFSGSTVLRPADLEGQFPPFRRPCAWATACTFTLTGSRTVCSFPVGRPSGWLTKPQIGLPARSPDRPK